MVESAVDSSKMEFSPYDRMASETRVDDAKLVEGRIGGRHACDCSVAPFVL